MDFCSVSFCILDCQCNSSWCPLDMFFWSECFFWDVAIQMFLSRCRYQRFSIPTECCFVDANENGFPFGSSSSQGFFLGEFLAVIIIATSLPLHLHLCDVMTYIALPHVISGILSSPPSSLTGSLGLSVCMQISKTICLFEKKCFFPV